MRNEERSLVRGKKPRVPALLILLLVGGLGILLLLFGSRSGDGKSDSAEGSGENSANALAAYTEALEEKIAALCEVVDGVSGVKVAVTLKSGYEYVYAKDAEVLSGDGTVTGTYHYITVGSGSSESVVYLSEKLPAIGGIGIVCRGGGDPKVQKELIDLITAAFGVGSNQIYVTEGTGNLR